MRLGIARNAVRKQAAQRRAREPLKAEGHEEGVDHPALAGERETDEAHGHGHEAEYYGTNFSDPRNDRANQQPLHQGGEHAHRSQRQADIAGRPVEGQHRVVAPRARQRVVRELIEEERDEHADHERVAANLREHADRVRAG
jgi:hypothetical protein